MISNGTVLEIEKNLYTVKDNISRGCYGTIYVVERNNHEYILKIYDMPEIAKTEYSDLLYLANIGLNAKIPNLYFCGKINQELIENECILMEKISGDKLSSINCFDRNLTERIVDALSHIHSIKSDDFRYLNCEFNKKYQTWDKMYINYINSIIDRYKYISKIQPEYNKSVDLLESVKDETISKLNTINSASLIHGDFTPWNIIINDGVVYIIDPFKMRFADSELDLIQLDKANGNQHKLLEMYIKKNGLSDLFYEKKKYYKLWNEAYHNLNSYRRSANCIVDNIKILKEQI